MRSLVVVSACGMYLAIRKGPARRTITLSGVGANESLTRRNQLTKIVCAILPSSRARYIVLHGKLAKLVLTWCSTGLLM